MKYSGILVAAFLGTTTQTKADDVCVELIRRAVYDEYAGREEASTYNEANRNLCRSYSQYKRDAQSGGASGSYGLYGGSANFDKDQISSVGEAMCESQYSLDKYTANRAHFQKTLNPAALQVVDNCVRANTASVRFSVLYPDEDTLVASVYFTPPPGDTTQRKFTNGINVPASLTCSGKLSEVGDGSILDSQSQDMTCRRVSQAPYDQGGRKFLHPGGSIVVSTSVMPLIALMPKKPDPVMPPPMMVDIKGNWYFGGNPQTPKLPQIALAADNKLEFRNERGEPSSGTRRSDTNVQAMDWGNLNGELRQKGRFLLWANGTWWSRDAFGQLPAENAKRILAGSWRIGGKPCSITGPNEQLTFTNEYGASSRGKLADPATVVATDWGNLRGRLLEGGSFILWENGTWWEAN